MEPSPNLAMFPGGDLVGKGLADLQNHVCSEEALLVLIASPRLARLGLTIQAPRDFPLPYEHALYSAIERRSPTGAHAAYNALIGRIVSFCQAYKPQLERPPGSLFRGRANQE